MKFRHHVTGIAGLTALALCGCSGIPRGAATIEFTVLRHFRFQRFSMRRTARGATARKEKVEIPLIALADPVYLAVADDAVIRRAAANGIAGRRCPRSRKVPVDACSTDKTDRSDCERHSRTLVRAGSSGGRSSPPWFHPSLEIPRADRKCTPTTVLPVMVLVVEAEKRPVRSWMGRFSPC